MNKNNLRECQPAATSAATRVASKGRQARKLTSLATTNSLNCYYCYYCSHRCRRHLLRKGALLDWLLLRVQAKPRLDTHGLWSVCLPLRRRVRRVLRCAADSRTAEAAAGEEVHTDGAEAPAGGGGALLLPPWSQPLLRNLAWVALLLSPSLSLSLSLSLQLSNHWYMLPSLSLFLSLSLLLAMAGTLGMCCWMRTLPQSFWWE